jgi:hypothetical protein
MDRQRQLLAQALAAEHPGSCEALDARATQWFVHLAKLVHLVETTPWVQEALVFLCSVALVLVLRPPFARHYVHNTRAGTCESSLSWVSVLLFSLVIAGLCSALRWLLSTGPQAT